MGNSSSTTALAVAAAAKDAAATRKPKTSIGSGGGGNDAQSLALRRRSTRNGRLPSAKQSLQPPSPPPLIVGASTLATNGGGDNLVHRSASNYELRRQNAPSSLTIRLSADTPTAYGAHPAASGCQTPDASQIELVFFVALVFAVAFVLLACGVSNACSLQKIDSRWRLRTHVCHRHANAAYNRRQGNRQNVDCRHFGRRPALMSFTFACAPHTRSSQATSRSRVAYDVPPGGVLHDAEKFARASTRPLARAPLASHLCLVCGASRLRLTAGVAVAAAAAARARWRIGGCVSRLLPNDVTQHKKRVLVSAGQKSPSTIYLNEHKLRCLST